MPEQSWAGRRWNRRARAALALLLRVAGVSDRELQQLPFRTAASLGIEPDLLRQICRDQSWVEPTFVSRERATFERRRRFECFVSISAGAVQASARTAHATPEDARRLASGVLLMKLLSLNLLDDPDLDGASGRKPPERNDVLLRLAYLCETRGLPEPRLVDRQLCVNPRFFWHSCCTIGPEDGSLKAVATNVNRSAAQTEAIMALSKRILEG